MHYIGNSMTIMYTCNWQFFIDKINAALLVGPKLYTHTLKE